MSDFPSAIDYSFPSISTVTTNSILLPILGVSNNSTTSTAWTSANLAIYIPFTIAHPFTPSKMWWINGVTVGTNNVDVGIYDSQGNQLFHSGSTLTSGVSVSQSVSVSSLTLQRGTYYFAMAMDGTTDVLAQISIGAVFSRAFGVLQQATAFPLPATATFATMTAVRFPIVGVTIQGVV